MIARIEGCVTYQQTFDAENRLVSVTASGQTTTMTYDGDGQRVKKVDAGGTTYSVGGYYEVKGSTVTKYYYLGGQRVAMRAGGVLYYLHGDHLGSTSLTTNTSQGIMAQQRYYPYGEVRWSSGALPTDYRFTGQREESGIKLYDYQAWYYSPYLARFISPDTLVPGMGSQALSRYMYVTGNPLLYADPTGHCGETGRLAGVCFDNSKAIGESINPVGYDWRFWQAMGTIKPNEDSWVKEPSGQVIPPIEGRLFAKVTKRFDYDHPGQDFGTGGANSTSVWSMADGTVVKMNFNYDGYGYYVVISHNVKHVPEGKEEAVVETVYGLYAHLAPGSFEEYDLKVSKGQAIGVLCLGTDPAVCGNTAGPHLHFEVRNSKGWKEWPSWTDLKANKALYKDYFYQPDEFIRTAQ